jgi:hypothetical protein
MQLAMDQRGMQGLMQPIIPMEDVQRLAMMMVITYGPRSPTGLRVLGSRGTGSVENTSFTIPRYRYLGDARMMTAEEGFLELASAIHDWKRLEMLPESRAVY